MSWLHVDIGPAAVLFGDRTGGVSAPPFDTANAGFLTGDDREAVAENRRRLGAAVGGPAPDLGTWTRFRQVHGDRVLTGADLRAARWQHAVEPVDADGAVTSAGAADGVTLAVLTADCGPVALAGESAFGLVHAGWRGVDRGVLRAAVATLRATDPSPIRAVIGPLARACCYEFGAGELDRLAGKFGSPVRATTRRGTPALDLPAAIRAALMAEGVAGDGIDDVAICTICDRDYFSHRRDGTPGPTGRQATVMVVRT